MKKLGIKSLFLIALSVFATQVSAVNIQNFRVTPNGRKYIEFSWDKLANSDIDQETHYGLQWSQNQSDIRIDKPTQARVSMTKNIFSMPRGDDVFDKDTYYYARVYGFYRGDMQRKNFLTKGSKILKFKWLNNGNVETEYIEPNDPTVVADNATTTVAKTFQRISVIPYDASVQVSWSRTNDIFDKYVLVLGEDSTLDNPLKEFEVDKTYNKALITGLEPNKRYYIAGFLKRNGQTYGKGATINFTTLPKFDALKRRRFEKYILGRKNYGLLLKLSDSVTTTSSNESNHEKTIVTDDSSTSVIRRRISEIRALIAKLNKELRELEAKVNPAKNSTSRLHRPVRRTGSLASRLRNWRSRLHRR